MRGKQFEWAKDINPNGQYTSKSKRCTLKPQWELTDSSKWLRLKRLIILSVGEVIKQRELSYTANKRINAATTLKNSLALLLNLKVHTLYSYSSIPISMPNRNTCICVCTRMSRKKFPGTSNSKQSKSPVTVGCINEWEHIHKIKWAMKMNELQLYVTTWITVININEVRNQMQRKAHDKFPFIWNSKIKWN